MQKCVLCNQPQKLDAVPLNEFSLSVLEFSLSVLEFSLSVLELSCSSTGRAWR